MLIIIFNMFLKSTKEEIDSQIGIGYHFIFLQKWSKL